MRSNIFVALLIFSVVALQGCVELQSENTAQLPHALVEQRLASSHPSNYFVYAARLYHEGAKEDAAFWFYVGQIRYKFYLAANPNLEPSSDPALYSSLHESVGSVINLWVHERQSRGKSLLLPRATGQVSLFRSPVSWRGSRLQGLCEVRNTFHERKGT